MGVRPCELLGNIAFGTWHADEGPVGCRVVEQPVSRLVLGIGNLMIPPASFDIRWMPD